MIMKTYEEKLAYIEAGMNKVQDDLKDIGLDFKYMITQSYGGTTFHGTFNVKINDTSET